MTTLLLLFALGATPEPVLVELFTSEGCSSCPPADALLRERAAQDPSVVALEFHVDYWNSKAWTDPFSSADYTQRQAQYFSVRGTSQVYTPEAVADGRSSFAGSDRGALDKALARGHTDGKKPLTLALKGDKLQISAADSGAGTLWLAITEAGLQTAVPRGENAGQVVKHAPVVRHFEALGHVDPGAWTQTVPLVLDPTWKKAALQVVALVQDPMTGAVRALGAIRP